MMFCEKCNKDFDDKSSFCPTCGSVLAKKQSVVYCQECGEKFSNNEKFCGNCGKKLTYPDAELKKALLFDNAVSSNVLNIPKDTAFYPKNGSYQSSYRDNKKRNHKPLIAFLVLVFIVFGVLVFLTKDKIFNSSNGKRTIMVYMIGSDIESKYHGATKDISEMRDSGVDFDKVNVLLYTGGATKWHSYDIPNDKHAIFRVTSEGLEKLAEYDNSNDMTNPENLSYFLKYGYDNYKADYYSLILWDHGGGPIYGYGSDEYHSYDSLTMDKIKKGLKDSPFGPENKLDFIGFDACLMGSIEVAHSLVDYTDYMIASEESEPGNGWDYSFLGDVTGSTDTLDIAKSVVDHYDSYYAKYKYITGVTLSVLRLNKLDNVELYLNKLFVNLDGNLDLDYSSISRSRSYSKSFGRDSGEYYYDLVDLVDFISRLPSKYNEDVSNLNNAINDFVVYNKTDLKESNGISIYFPYEYKQHLSEIMKIYNSFGFAKDYYNFISNFSNKLTGKRMNNFDLSRSKVNALGESAISITLPKEVINNYSSAEYVLFIKNDNNTYTPVYSGSDITVEENTMRTTVSRKLLSITDSEGNELYLTAIESARGKDFIKYLIPITLNRFGEDYSYEITNAYIEYVVDTDNPNGYIGRVVPMIKYDNNVSVREEIEIKDYDVINFNTYEYKILDAKGKYNKKWESTGKITSMQLDTSEEYKLEFKDLDISNTYYALFKIKDSQGNITYSNIVLVKNK